WAIKYSSAMRIDPRYGPSDAFETFPRPVRTSRLDKCGEILHRERREIMLRRDLGLTDLYNLVNDPGILDDADVHRLREIHVEIDEATMEAYGWDDVALDHGFHTYRQMGRWSVSSAARIETLDRLLELNHASDRAGGQDVPRRCPHRGWVRGWLVGGPSARCGRGDDYRCGGRRGALRGARLRWCRGARRPIPVPGCG